MINHLLLQRALRTKLLTLQASTTGATTITATATGYTRASGSFADDGFWPGMEVTGTGFSEAANNSAKTITGVTALTLTCSGCTAESAGSRTLSCDLPDDRAWENLKFEPTTGKPYVEENYLPGPMGVIESGTYATLEVFPTYVVKVYVPADVGADGARAYGDALLTLFAPGTRLTVSGHTVIVRENPAPYPGQLIPNDDGFATMPVTIPLRVTTTNTV